MRRALVPFNAEHYRTLPKTTKRIVPNNAVRCRGLPWTIEHYRLISSVGYQSHAFSGL